MKRDMDLVRKILLALEAYEHGYAPSSGFMIRGYDGDVIEYHLRIMKQGDLIGGETVTAHGDTSPMWLTWQGHEFLDAVRDDEIWSGVNRLLRDDGLSPSFVLLQELALKILSARLGLPFE